MKISVIIPAFNEEKNIKNTIFTLDKLLYENFTDYEIIVVNDGSNDRTKHILNEIFLNIHIINLNENHGKGYAIKQGIKYAGGDYIIFTDADLAYDVKNIKLFEDKLKKSDIVIGVRNIKKDCYSLKRRLYSNAFGYVTSLMLNEKIDTQCGIKGFRKHCAKRIFPHIKTDGFAFDFEILYLAKKMKFSIDKINVVMNRQEKSSINFIKDPFFMLTDVLRVKMFDISGGYNLSESEILGEETKIL